jgi:peptidoglycan/xylan/chitin deacetylase (PgdA/CDA1 family)
MRRFGALLLLVLVTGCTSAAVVDRGPTDRREAALTFDVAYDARYTGAFLDVLKRYQVRATMFVTGEWADANPALVRRMAAEGHLVGNHSYDHPDFTTITDAELSRQVASAEGAISARTNRSTKPYFRPPYGAQNAHVNQLLGNEGFRYDVLWTVDSLGWKGLSVPEVVKRCLDRAAPGAVFMFHLSAKPDLDALPWIIQWLQDNRYTLVRLDRWFA